MRVPLGWLREYVDVNLSPEDLARRLTLSTVEIEAIERSREWNNVRVAEVLEVVHHPNSDHLSLATVQFGAEQFHVVCGAPNVAAGQRIAYAGIGARLIDAQTGEQRTLKAAKIRGVDSNGMICSGRELGLSDEHEGILVLPQTAPIGKPLGEYLGETVLVAGAWAHRADLLAILGFAREVAALTGSSAREPDLDFQATAGDVHDSLSVEIEAPDLCARYIGAVIEGVNIGHSPQWMQDRLTAAGMRPISNVVDITNYVMFEYGQPLHAFDYDRIRDHHINVRRARQGERLTTLDGVDRSLNPDTMVIADPSGPVALAGVMGGAETEVSGGTTNVLLESANFLGINIRRTSTLLGLRSEASARFEKQLPAELAERAARRAVQLLVKYAGGRARAGFVDAYPLPQPPVRIDVTADRMRRVLGIDVPTRDVVNTLHGLGFECEWQPPDRYSVTVPYWRTDVSIPEDVTEEVIRILGFDRLPSTTIAGRLPPYLPQPKRELRDRIKDLLVAAGGQEIITYSAVSEDVLRKALPVEDLAITQPLRIVNPVSGEHELMRTTLRGSMLEAVSSNLKLKRPSISLFEAAVVFVPGENRAELPVEQEMLIGAISGQRRDRWGHASGDSLDFFDAKGYLECVDARLGVGFAYSSVEDPILLPGRSAEVKVEGRTLGITGQVHPDVLARFNIDAEVFLYELNLGELLPMVKPVRKFRPIARYPAVEQDLALVVDRSVAASDLANAISRSKLIAAAEVFDEYAGSQVPDGKKSLAFRLLYQSPDKTLTDDDVAREQERILRGLKHQFDAKLRG
ncbi:MAG TPA: phenylalanine--tRNA ligase subunit beta [Dehalococcoidia bacterium]